MNKNCLFFIFRIVKYFLIQTLLFLFSYISTIQYSTMKTVIPIFLAFILCLYSHSAIVGTSSSPTDPKDIEKEIKAKFEKFKADYGKAYSPDVETLRATTFRANLVKIEQHNKKNKDYTLGITPFADLSQSQFKELYLMKPLGNIPQSPSQQPNVSAIGATSVDWTTKAGPVRNQGSCGSCWAFAVVGSIQINERIKKSLSTTRDYSEQQVVDCCRSIYGPYKSNGCSGGYLSEGFTYLVGGLATQTSYPYKTSTNTCITSVSKTKVISGYTRYAGATNALTMLATGSTAVAIDAGRWSLYKGGVFTDCSSTVNKNHGVVLVGVSSGSYWKIRNSWGSNWGESGYMKISYTKTCGLTDYSYVPKLL